jgi:enoyl-CoA hydratase/carnithine racemase
MSVTDASPSNNGHRSDERLRSWTQFTIDRRTPSYCRVTFNHPPTNVVTPTTVAELAELVELIENDADLNVVVFDSANPSFYLTDHDREHDAARTTPATVRETGMPLWRDALERLARAPVMSIASIRGCVGGAGSEFALACDIRFVSRENTLMDLETLQLAEDCDGPRAEQYGYVNRAIADDQLDAEVEAMAQRLARIEHGAIVRTKSYLAGRYPNVNT